MADNVVLNPGNSGATIRSDDDGTAQWQYVKLAFGADGTQTIVTSTASNPFPVALSDTDNAVLDQIETNTSYGDNTGAGTEANSLRVTLANDSTGLVSVDDNGGSLTVDNATISVVGGGVEATAQRVTLANDSTGVLSVDDGGGALTVDGTVTANPASGTIDTVTAFGVSTAGPMKAEDVASAGGDMGIPAYAVRDDALAANGGVGTDGDYLPLRTNNDGALWVQSTVGSLGGSKFFNDIDLDEADIDVATGPCTVYSIYCYNSTAAPLFLKMFNTNSVTMGTTAADLSVPIPGNADSDGAGFVFPIPVSGVAFGTALTVAVTTGLALDDNTAPGANAANVTIMYQD